MAYQLPLQQITYPQSRHSQSAHEQSLEIFNLLVKTAGNGQEVTTCVMRDQTALWRRSLGGVCELVRPPRRGAFRPRFAEPMSSRAVWYTGQASRPALRVGQGACRMRAAPGNHGERSAFLRAPIPMGTPSGRGSQCIPPLPPRGTKSWVRRPQPLTQGSPASPHPMRPSGPTALRHDSRSESGPVLRTELWPRGSGRFDVAAPCAGRAALALTGSAAAAPRPRRGARLR